MAKRAKLQKEVALFVTTTMFCHLLSRSLAVIAAISGRFGACRTPHRRPLSPVQDRIQRRCRHPSGVAALVGRALAAAAESSKIWLKTNPALRESPIGFIAG
jgi:hypothetical protein